ncbi:MAG: phosphate ABC transporter substrate-binding protein PstS family protein [Planctomycetales bacterium]|nr:phosphate ABC transporter substrate-binding protein PstS family protein [Planctomycetales bacterium]
MRTVAEWVRAGGVATFLITVVTGCSGSSPGPASDGEGTAKVTIRIDGSDTMVNLAQAWAEEYNQIHPDISVQVSGGGSGVGIASLITGVTDMANSSRKMKEKEIERAKANTGKEPQEFIVGKDALAVYVHADNPLDAIAVDQLAEIYGEGGQLTKWSQLGVQNRGCASDEITRVSRQNNSGTYHYFREAILGNARDFQLGSIDQSGSKDVVALISRTPCAIGYSGMGYRTEGVKWLKIATEADSPAVAPSVSTARDGFYPIARPLYLYTLGEPSEATQEYINWMLSEEGQKIVLKMGYVPVRDVPAE